MELILFTLNNQTFHEPKGALNRFTKNSSLPPVKIFTQKILKNSQKNIKIYLHFTMKIFCSFSQRTKFTTLGKRERGNSQKVFFYLFTRNQLKFLYRYVWVKQRLCLRLYASEYFNICWMKLIFSLRLYNKLGIFRGLNPPTRTLISFTKNVQLVSSFFSLADYYTMPSKLMWISAIVVSLSVYYF